MNGFVKMQITCQNNYNDAHLMEKDFKRLGEFIQSELGIKMPKNKIVMVEARLRKRVRKLNFGSYTDYCDYLFSDRGIKQELPFMIDEITTNKTEFFREPDHFDCLYEKVLPELTCKKNRRLSIWSAACSTGEEPYSLAMVLDDYSRQHPETKLEFHIEATDISPEVIRKANGGIYLEERVESIKMDFKKKYLMRSKDREKKLVRIVPELREKVTFRNLNLMDAEFNLDRSMDIVFCRNVIIYFDRETQKALLERICGCIKPGGYLFMGHSEVLAGMDLPLKSIATTVYKKLE
jgi:chemotaxis protein methyltransferase CheR